MNKHTRRTPAKQDLLPFEEWMRKRYPGKTPGKQLLRMIGAFDLMYLLYRAGLIEHAEEPEHEIAPIRRAIRKTAAVKTPEQEAEAVKPKRARKPARRAGSRKKDLTIEFETAAPEPLPEAASVEEKTPEPVAAPEPEPLELNEEAPAPSAGGTLWLGDESLEDQDPRKTREPLGVNGIAVGFDTRTVDDERETLLVVNGTSYAVHLVTPPMNLSAMLQIARVTYGELYVLGRAALGAVSGEGYVPAAEAERIVWALSAAPGKTLDLDVAYFTRDAKTRNRASSVMRVRFEPV